MQLHYEIIIILYMYSVEINYPLYDMHITLGMWNSLSYNGSLKNRNNCSWGHHMGGKNHNSLLPLIADTSLRYILISLFSYKYKQIWLPLKHFYPLFNWNSGCQVAIWYECILNLEIY